jgi:hypothetical protein
MFDLRSWLRRAPKPKKLRIKTGDGEERVIELGRGRYLWNEVEHTVRTAEAISVECLDAEGTILRATRLTEEDPEDFEAAGKESADGKAVTKAMAAQATMLDAYGRRMNEAFARGAEAASTSQDKLVALVEVLTQHLTLAITNLHNISTNYAQVVAATGKDSEGLEPGQLLQGLMAMIANKSLAPAPAPAPAPNGAAKKKP